MAEAVKNGVDGLHVRRNDPASLAAAMRNAADDVTLYRQLSAKTQKPPTVAQVADQYLQLFAGKAQNRKATPQPSETDMTAGKVGKQS